MVDIPDNSKKPSKSLTTRAFSFLVLLIAVLVIVGLVGIYAPTVFFAILNFFWISFLIIAAVFLLLGTLVIVGMKSEVSRILDMVLEGGLTVLDFIDFLRAIVRNFIALIKEFILFAVPLFSFIAAGVVYLALLYVYKTVGAQNDVTWFTIVITFSLVFIVGYLNRPLLVEEPVELTWSKKVAKKFKAFFNDSLEVVIFIFFLTLDSTKFFFIPPRLNVELHAELGNYNLMERGFLIDRITIILVVAAIVIEVFRNILRVIVGAFVYYKEGQNLNITQNLNYRALHIFKESIRKSFTNLKDDLMRLLTFTTFLIFVFLLFPRLKLLAMTITSITFLLLDFIFPARMTTRVKSTDLVSRILSKLFKV